MDLLHIIFNLIKNDIWHLICDMWHGTPDMWRMLHETWFGVNILSTFQLSSSNGLGVMMFWKTRGKAYSLRQVISDRDVCTKGLLIIWNIHTAQNYLIYWNICRVDPFVADQPHANSNTNSDAHLHMAMFITLCINENSVCPC